ncbi:DNA polymerase I [Natranaerobius thermophilus]|uniref:DNA polymerase I n=1 Tax=Natranaerobius thermophilus (strain ATCC BAA-1301 / DSM 18059 / JW/NM-WN-LF) TaxID=457570 RepID=B2A646_NATTJ|nr:DNA polymerase I [Natranaerobius thermophilus]ACB85463.1 DNA polymerase I [Natranaerobius thermophilus JW/NM-WN-LF]
MNSNDYQANDKFVVIDGNSLLNRAFYALPLLQTKQGFFTNAIYGFTTMLLKLVQDESPNYLAVVFDTKAKTFRHHKFPEYKGHRDKAPDEMRPQMPMLKELLEAMNINYFEKDGYEADDLIGAFTKIAKQEDKETMVVTGDKDLLQLLDDKTTILLTKKGITQMESYDGEKVKEEFGVNVDKLIDLKALTGDKSDNVPGVPGVGKKTALKLLNNYGDLEKLYKSLDGVGGKLQSKLADNKDKAFLSKELVTIDCEESLIENLDWNQLSKFEIASPKARELLQEWEMNSILERLPASDEEQKKDQSPVNEGKTSSFNWDNFYYISEFPHENSDNLESELEKFIQDGNHKMALYRHLPKKLSTAKQKDSYPEPEGGLVVSINDLIFYVPEKLLSQVLAETIAPKLIKGNDKGTETEDAPKLKIASYNIKRIWHLFKNNTELDLYDLDTNKFLFYDTELMAYLLEPTEAPHSIEDMMNRYYGQFDLTPYGQDWQAVCERGAILLDLISPLEDILQERNQWQLYKNIELPLAFILARMEFRGIKVDARVLTEMEANIDHRLSEISTKIFEIAGEEFNLNSPKQLGYILFEKLQLPVVKKTKTGYSTDAKTLETLSHDYEICKLLLDYRQLHKLKTTYLVGLKDLISKTTGKIHTTYNQTITATGRLSSTDPNLQNIPIKLEEGRKIRKGFVIQNSDQLFLAADYSQIELRILAHVSEDTNLIQAFQEQQDIHTQTAAQVFEVESTQVTREMRSHAKAVNFGIVYGISDYGLSRQLGISRKQAKTYIDNYLTRFSGVKEYMDQIVNQAKMNGYVETLYNRRRNLPDISHRNFNIRSAAERTAINTPIQGTAADIIKDAMVKVEKELEKQDLLDKAALLLQVHDELILEINKEVLSDVATKVKEIMENIIELKVPLTVDLKTGPNWYDLNPYQSGE